MGLGVWDIILLLLVAAIVGLAVYVNVGRKKSGNAAK